MGRMTDDRKPDVTAAYALRTPEDSVRLYRDWAGTYEDGFAAEQDYVYPQRLAEFYAAEADPGEPVLDVGAGTGLVGRALRTLGVETVDGLDISPDMLEVARARGGYRALIEADVTRPLSIADGAYGGLVSAGTFTHGHVGPDPLPELLRTVAEGARITLGVNAAHFEAEGFAAAFDRLAAEGLITPVRYVEIPVYGPRATHAHKHDTALIVAAERR